jgi:glycosyltransferase involved in cell wall biosynthesis
LKNGAGISAVIITFNESAHIGRCIDSVSELVDEVLVVDSFSTDDTCEIAQSKGARVIQHAFEGHIQQKNWAKDQARHNWVLSIDADECLSDTLQKNLQNAINNGLLYGNAKGFVFSRLNHLGARPIRGCGWYPDAKLRLWDRTCGRWGGRNPHDKFILDKGHWVGKTIDGDILHYTYPDLAAVKLQALKFGKIGAQAVKEDLVDSGGAPVRHQGVALYLAIKLLSAGLIRFVRNYLLRGGWKYGSDGLMICYWQMAEVTLKYAGALFGKRQSPS